LATNILIVDDERAIREMVCLALTNEGYQCHEAGNAHEAEGAISYAQPDLILLDWMMPGVSGVDFARRLRRQQETRLIPIIMLTAKSDEDDKVRGLDSGADDYLTKPFSIKELLARIRSLLRRVQPQDESEIYQCQGLVLESPAQRVLADDKQLEMGPTEYKLLKFFMENKNRVFTRGQLLDHVWGNNVYIEERTIDVHIRRLRKALEAGGYDHLIQTVRGSGYRFSEK